MNCQELHESLLLLAYDELSTDEAARCEAHLAGCADCRAALTQLRGTQRVLDLAPHRTAQVDLAAVCLRIADRERRSRRTWQWGAGIMALAASILVLASATFLRVRVEPGQFTIAWQQPVPAPFEPTERPAGQSGAPAAVQFATGNAVSSATQKDRSETGPRAPSSAELARLTARADAASVHDLRMRNGWRSLNSDALRYAQPAFEAAVDPHGGSSYQELRRELLDFAPTVADAVTPPDA